MRAILTFLLIGASLSLCGCGNVWVGGALNTSSFSGMVSIVRLTATNDGTQVTFVTLVDNMSAHDFTFCGNVVNQFPMNVSVLGSFRPGSSCGSIVQVTVKG